MLKQPEIRGVKAGVCRLSFLHHFKGSSKVKVCRLLYDPGSPATTLLACHATFPRGS